MEKTSKAEIAMIAGNGVSISCDQNLFLPNLTKRVRERLSEEYTQSPVGEALTNLALKIGTGDPNQDFEALVGSLEDLKISISQLEHLSQMSGVSHSDSHNGLKNSISEVTHFIEKVHLIALTHVLQATREYSKANQGNSGHLELLIKQLLDHSKGEIAIANLNYDGLFLASILKVKAQLKKNPTVNLTDMTRPLRETALKEWRKTLPVEVQKSKPRPFRGKDDPEFIYQKGRVIRLYHLHGSLGFWEWTDANETKELYALNLGVCDNEKWWDEIRSGKSNWRPVVVVSNVRNKNSQISQFPFNRGYEEFEEKLKSSPRWIIAGYSLRDDGMNEMLGRAFSHRLTQIYQDKGFRNLPVQILFSTYGDVPTREEVEAVLGWNAHRYGSSESWLTIHRQGAQNLPDSSEWSSFLTQSISAL